MASSKALIRQKRAAYRFCQQVSQRRGENFPVASYFLPPSMRRAIIAIYAFAREADDIADEGQANREARLDRLMDFETKLYNIQYGKPPTDPLFIALEDTLEHYRLPIQLFYDLLTAFRQDILKPRYTSFSEVKDYCRYSANPIGRLLLHLTGQASPENLCASDQICTGLQLMNFLQDLHEDLHQRDRLYIPLEELAHYNLSIQDLSQQKPSLAYRALICAQIERIASIYHPGCTLGERLPGLFGLEARFIIACGQSLLLKLAKRADIFARPTLVKKEMLLCFWRALWHRPITDAGRLYAACKRV